MIGELLRTARQARRMSRVELAESSGVSIRSIRGYENGEVDNPSFIITAKIARAMQIDLNQLAELAIGGEQDG